jgi:hypothetical protein
MSRSVALGILLATAVVLPLGPGPRAGSAAPEPARYSLAIDVAFGAPPGPERTLRRIVEQVLARLAGTPCFASVDSVPLETPRDLVLRVRLDDFEDVTRNESSIAERVSPNANPMDMASRVVATVSAHTRIELRLDSTDGPLVRSRTFLAAESWRPQAGEDPHAAAEDLFIERVAEEVQTLACKGGPAKLARAIDKSRAPR